MIYKDISKAFTTETQRKTFYC